MISGQIHKSDLPEITTTTEGLCVGVVIRPAVKNGDDVIQDKILGDTAIETLFGGEFSSLTRREILAVSSLFRFFAEMMIDSTRKAGKHLLSVFLPELLGSLRNALPCFLSVLVIGGVLIPHSLAFASGRDSDSGGFRMGFPPERIRFASEQFAQTFLGTGRGNTLFDLSGVSVELIPAYLTDETSASSDLKPGSGPAFSGTEARRSFEIYHRAELRELSPALFASECSGNGSRHSYASSINRVNSVNNSTRIVYAIHVVESTPNQAAMGKGIAEGLTTRRVSPNNNPAHERPTRKGRDSLSYLVTDRNADKEPHDNTTDELLDTTPQEGITMAQYNWKEYGGTIAISRAERRKNSGKHRLLNLLDAKTQQAEMSLKDKLTTDLFANITSTPAKAIDGIFLHASSTPSTTTLGSVSGATYSWWRNYQTDVGAYANNLEDKLRTGYNSSSAGGADFPDGVLCSQTAYEYYESLGVGGKRFVNEQKTLDLGFEVLQYKGADMFWDGGISSNVPATGESIILLNSGAIRLVIDSESDFVTTDFIEPENQTATVAKILTMLNLCTNNRRKLGILHGIDAS